MLPAVNVRFAEKVAVPSFAEILVANWLTTAFVATVKLADDCAAAILTVAGTVTELELLVSATASPPTGATDDSVTVPVVVPPPVTVVGLRLNPVSAGGLIVRVAPMDVVARFAVIFANCLVGTAFVEILKVADFAPPAMATVPGRVASLELLASLIDNPLAGAIDVISTVPVAEAPPVKESDESDKLESLGA